MSKDRLHILIDVDAAAVANKSGIGYYTQGLLEALATSAPTDVTVTAHYFNFLGREAVSLPELPNVEYQVSRFVPRSLANLFRRYGLLLPYELLTQTRPDFIIFPNFLSRPTFYKTPYAVTVHDFTYLDHPEYVSAKNRSDLTKLIPTILRSAAFAVAISHTMADQLRKNYPWFDKPIVAEPLPVQDKMVIDESEADKQLSKLSITKPYVLFLGNTEPRKNITGLIDAFSRLPKPIRHEYQLVLAGGEGWNNQSILEQIKSAQEAGVSVVHTGYVSEAQRTALYTRARVFAFVSLYEGYGLPLLEAMTYNVPVLSSDIPVLREVAGDAALFCDPKNVDDIAAKLEEIISNDSLRRELIGKGESCVQQKSWRTVAESIYRELLKHVSSEPKVR